MTEQEAARKLGNVMGRLLNVGGLSLQEQVERFKSSMTPGESRAIELRFGLDEEGVGSTRTYSKVGQEIGRSRWTASRRVHNGLEKFRAASMADPLPRSS